jgi:plasmid stabilization system protein ParE
MEQGKHGVFYREALGGVFIARILHGRMLPEDQVIKDQDDDSNSSEG